MNLHSLSDIAKCVPMRFGDFLSWCCVNLSEVNRAMKGSSLMEMERVRVFLIV